MTASTCGRKVVESQYGAGTGRHIEMRGRKPWQMVKGLCLLYGCHDVTAEKVGKLLESGGVYRCWVTLPMKEVCDDLIPMADHFGIQVKLLPDSVK